jgi:hypothetical protein
MVPGSARSFTRDKRSSPITWFHHFSITPGTHLMERPEQPLSITSEGNLPEK